MKNKSYHLDRRTFLRGVGGLALGLPFLEAMDASATGAAPAKRFCALFFPYGVPLPPEDHPHHDDWNWFPSGEGRDYHLTKTLSPLEPLRDDFTILGGLSHPTGRSTVGHAVGDIFLTGSNAHRTFRNTQSLDQVIAEVAGERTRLPSLVMSSEGGIGTASRSYTLSFTRTGNPIPALERPSLIFEMLFGRGTGSLAEQRRGLEHKQSMLDRILEDARDLNRRLGREDRQRMDEYLSSVREIERRTERAKDWLKVAKPKVEKNEVTKLDAAQDQVENYLRTMFDLIYLAFRTDQTRVATYMISSETARVSEHFPTLALGLTNAHALSHNPTGKNPETGWEDWGRYNQFLTQQFAYFLDRMRQTREGDSTLLDNSIILYGCSTSRVHLARNYPLILAGGKKLGFKHGRFLKFTEDTPFSNTHLTIARKMGVNLDSFADSVGEVSELLT